jgi:hypothetical protein
MNFITGWNIAFLLKGLNTSLHMSNNCISITQITNVRFFQSTDKEWRKDSEGPLEINYDNLVSKQVKRTDP